MTSQHQSLLAALEESNGTKLIPSFTGWAAPNELERNLFSLPVRLGGLNSVSPTTLLQFVFRIRFLFMLHVSTIPFTVRIRFVCMKHANDRGFGCNNAEVSGACSQSHLLLPPFIDYYKIINGY